VRWFLIDELALYVQPSWHCDTSVMSNSLGVGKPSRYVTRQLSLAILPCVSAMYWRNYLTKYLANPANKKLTNWRRWKHNLVGGR